LSCLAVFAVRFPAIAEVGDEFVVLVEDADAAVQFRHENFVLCW